LLQEGALFILFATADVMEMLLDFLFLVDRWGMRLYNLFSQWIMHPTLSERAREQLRTITSERSGLHGQEPLYDEMRSLLDDPE
jgi:hypothetical protein